MTNLSSAFNPRRLLHLLMVFIAAMSAYANTFDAPFYFDDANVIFASPVVKDLNYFLHPSKVADVYTPYKDHIKILMNSRYVGYLTLALNYKADGLNVRGYHIVNTAIHAINGMILYLLVIWLFRTPKLSANPLAMNSNWIALFASLLFVAHPIQTQAVTYIVQRFTSLSTLFYLSAIFFYLKARTDKRTAFHSVALLMTALALNTKEIAYTIPLTAALIEWLFFDGSMKDRARAVAPYFILTALIGVWMFGGGVGTGSELSLKAQTDTSRLDYLFTEATVVARYLRLIVHPSGLTFDYDWPVYKSFFQPEVIGSFVLLCAMLTAGFLSLKNSSLRLVSFGIFWFFIAHIIESGAIPIADVIFEHRMYLPSAGLFIAVAGLASYLYGKRRFSVVIVALSILMIIALFSATIARNNLWRNDIAFWQDNVRNAPNKPRVHLQLADAYLKHNMLAEAAFEYENVLKLDPYSVDALTNVGTVYIRLGWDDRAEDRLLRAIALRPNSVEGYNNIGNMYFNIHQEDKAMKYYMKALEADNNSAMTLYNIASIYSMSGEYGNAVEYFNRAIVVNPMYYPAHQNYGVLLAKIGDLEGAISEYKAAININPDYLLSHKHLAYIYSDLKDISNAIAEYQEVVRLDPADAVSRQELELLKKQMTR